MTMTIVIMMRIKWDRIRRMRRVALAMLFVSEKMFFQINSEAFSKSSLTLTFITNPKTSQWR